MFEEEGQIVQPNEEDDRSRNLGDGIGANQKFSLGQAKCKIPLDTF